MHITNISNLRNTNSLFLEGAEIGQKIQSDRNQTFETLFQSALNMVKETNNLTKDAQKAEMDYAMGLTTNTHDLQIAQSKANISLQYTVAVRNAVLDAYKEIMQLQF